MKSILTILLFLATAIYPSNIEHNGSITLGISSIKQFHFEVTDDPTSNLKQLSTKEFTSFKPVLGLMYGINSPLTPFAINVGYSFQYFNNKRNIDNWSKEKLCFYSHQISLSFGFTIKLNKKLFGIGFSPMHVITHGGISTNEYSNLPEKLNEYNYEHSLSIANSKHRETIMYQVYLLPKESSQFRPGVYISYSRLTLSFNYSKQNKQASLSFRFLQM